MRSIVKLEEVSEVLQDQGYEVKFHEDAIYTVVGGMRSPFVAVLTIKNQQELVITCQVARLGDLKESALPEVQFSLLDLNTQIRPFAFGIVTAADDPEIDKAEDYPIVLIDSMPLVDLSSEELIAAMDSLLVALEASGEAIKLGL